jgi:hypothetical protein
MTLRTTSLLAAVALAGLAVAAFAQGGGFDPGPPPPLPEATGDEAYPDDEPDADELASEEQEADSDGVIYESYEVVQPIPDTPGPATRMIEPPAQELVAAEPARSPARNPKLVKLERIAQAPARDKRVRIRQ